MRYFLLLIGFQATLSAADSLPPVGKRVYIVESDSVFSPVKIERDRNSVDSKSELRDPLLQNSESHEKVSRPALGIGASTPNEKASARLVFKPVPIKGRHATPRVTFSLESLELKQAFHPVSLDLEKRLIDQLHRQEQELRSLEP